MFEVLKAFFSRRAPSDGLKQDQREAIIDLLLICMHADNDLDLNEERIMGREVEHFSWDSEVSLKDYMKSAEARILAIIASAETRRPVLREIAARLRRDEVKYRAVKLCKLLFYADGHLDAQEVVFINEIESALGMR